VTSNLIYVIQKHQASHLHCDFRLEWNGVLLSWAIPKGPSLNPSTKRWAVQVDDHPVAYSRFEGVIPEGNYGAGTVMIWDQGYWKPDNPHVDEDLANGEIKFTLYGTKLKDAWVLARMRSRFSNGRSAWLLIKQHDSYASSVDLALKQPLSAATGRNLAEIRVGGR
jgi:bifunctional non-homologous end joining protein LigD